MPSFWDIMTGIVTLVIVLLVFYAAYAVSKWLSSRVQHSGGRQMKVLESITIGKDRYIMLIEIGTKIMAVGVTGQSVHTLANLSADDLKELEPPPEGQSFHSILSEMMGKKLSGRWKKTTDKEDSE